MLRTVLAIPPSILKPALAARFFSWSWGWAFIFFLSAVIHSEAQETHLLTGRILPVFDGQPLALGTLALTSKGGQTLSVERCDFLLSGLALQKDSGEWITAKNWAAYIGIGEGRTDFSMGRVPVGRYSRIRFHVGLEPDLNGAEAGQYPAGHPLNPAVNGLHWSWLGGYVFLALEGRWKDETLGLTGFSYHLASSRCLMTVELPVDLDLHADTRLTLKCDVAQMLGQQRFSRDTMSTHSREGDELAALLCRQVEKSFSVDSLASAPPIPAAPPAAHRVALNPQATLHPFRLPRYLPIPVLPGDNPLTEEGIALGRALFRDPQLSCNGSQSCATCHDPGHGLSDARSASPGAEGQAGRRHAMPLSNLAWKSAFFWDGRAASLREQVLQPIENPSEMHETLPHVVEKLSRDARYPKLFQAAFGTEAIDGDLLARALEQYLLTLQAHQARFDRVMRGEVKFSEDEQSGFDLFHTEYDPRRGLRGADCFHCHGGPLFRSVAFANNGLDGEFKKDGGRSEVTHREADLGKFAVPSLRNVAQTGPYMHDGRFQTLEEVIDHYSTGVKRSATLDPNLAKHPDGGVHFSEAEKRSLIAFLRTLTEDSP